MPITVDEWNAGEIDFFPRLRSAIMTNLNATTKAYTKDEIIDLLELTDDDLSDEIKDSLKALAEDKQWHALLPHQQRQTLAGILATLSAEGRVEEKKITPATGDAETYYRGVIARIEL